MRTDSTRVSEQALDGRARVHRPATFGADFVPEKPNVYKTKTDAQDAHEAIRPTSMQYHPETVRAQLTPDQYYLYQSDLEPLRRVADAAGDVRRDDGRHRRRPTTCSASRARCRSSPAGWRSTTRRRAEADESRAARAPTPATRGRRRRQRACCRALAKGDTLELQELKPEQKFTQPPPRYSEATLVKALEENGIGRPSTYASIISVIQARDYVNKIEGKLQADDARPDARREAAQPGVRRHPRRRVHARTRRGSRQDRGGHVELREDARRASTRSSRRT